MTQRCNGPLRIPKDEVMKRRLVLDGNGEPVPHGRNPVVRPTQKEETYIRGVLKLPKRTPFPRCRYRDWKKAVELDRKLGFTHAQTCSKTEGFHTLANHTCEACRCSRTAGWGTRGWWYWPQDNAMGFGEVGHFGVGPCFDHGPYNSVNFGGFQLDNYRSTINTEIEAMQNTGMAVDRVGGRFVQLREKVAEAKERVDLRTTYKAALELLDQCMSDLYLYRNSDRDYEQCLGAICKELGMEREWLEDDVEARLKMALAHRPLTQTANGRSVPMSDDKALTLYMKMLTDAAKLGKDVLKCDMADYFHRDEVRVFGLNIMAAIDRICRPHLSDKEWANLITELERESERLEDRHR